MDRMSTVEQRQRVLVGLRVKVPFNDPGGKEVWFGGIIRETIDGGQKIGIEYGDETYEVVDFPCKNIFVQYIE